MKGTLLIFLSFVFLVACQDKPKVISEEMNASALGELHTYLITHGLEKEGITAFNSKGSSRPDIAFLYTGSNRCIEFVFECYGQDCTEMRWYPYDEHGDECP